MSRRTSAMADKTKDDQHPLIESATTADDKQLSLLGPSTAHFSLIRALHLADLITLLNGLCGVLSIFACIRYPARAHEADRSDLTLALTLLPFALFFDFMDGRVARWRKKSSVMGQELDSLADLISFGVAPASIAYAMGIDTPADTACLAFFVLCGLTRLARFNVTATSGAIPKDGSGKANYFEGTPIPMSLGIDAAMGYWLSQGWIADQLPLGTWSLAGIDAAWAQWHPVTLLFVLHGCTMTSKTLKVWKP